ncbi:TolB family protein [Nonomuraea sp. 10N515B]|uniref:TolB family protein n=1 Tax=Nonomuraea sp. 10N515B TaxID=3457422 RepID=UPI003FCD7F57
MRHPSATAALLAAAVLGGLGLVPGAAHARTAPPVARAAWVKSCYDKKEGDSFPCGHWRLLWRDGKQTTVRDAAITTIDAAGEDVRESGTFAISGDGRVLAYERAGDHRLVVRSAAGGPATVLPKSSVPKGVGTDEIGVELSPAGDKVLIDYLDDPTHLPTKVITVATGKITTLPAADTILGFSGDGDEVLATRLQRDNTTAMYAYRLDGGAPITSTPPQVVANALAHALAPDGKTVATFTTGDTHTKRPPRVRIYDLETGDLSAAADLPVSPGAVPYGPWWSADGRLNVVVQSGEDGQPAVIRVLTVDPQSREATQADTYTISKTRHAYFAAGE